MKKPREMSAYQRFIDSASKSVCSSANSSPQKSRIKLDSEPTSIGPQVSKVGQQDNKMIAECGIIRSARFEQSSQHISSAATDIQQANRMDYYTTNPNPNPNQYNHHHHPQYTHMNYQSCQNRKPESFQPRNLVIPMEVNYNYNYNCNNDNINNNTNINTPSRNFDGRLKQSMDSIVKTKDPVLLEWLKAIRFETDLEGLTSLQARTLTIDEYSAQALSVRNSQVTIQAIRSNSKSILAFIDSLIQLLPLSLHNSNCSIPLSKFQLEFSELWKRLMEQTVLQPDVQTGNVAGNLHNLTITNCSPRKSLTSSKLATRPLDKLRAQLRGVCIELANHINDAIMFEEEHEPLDLNQTVIDNCLVESLLRKTKELFGKFVEISIRFECANIVRALEYDFSQSSLNRLSSTASLRPVRPFESSSAQLPLKWALIALWQLTKDDSYLCRTLTEKWQTVAGDGACIQRPAAAGLAASHRVAKRLDYSTKYDSSGSTGSTGAEAPTKTTNTNATCSSAGQSSIISDYEKLYQICQRQHNTVLPPISNWRQDDGSKSGDTSENDENCHQQLQGALSSAIKSKHQQESVRQLSTIELLIDIIISQPNKHERLDMMNLIHMQAQNSRLIDIEELDQSVSAAIYTSNQYKVAALRILNHLCVNDQAVKTILKCFSTPPPNPGHPIPENKIIRSIFECYQTSQEHIYQNETTLAASHGHHTGGNGNLTRRGLKRSRQARQLEEQREDYSDYGSRNTNSQSNTDDYHTYGDEQDSELSDASSGGDDLVVKEAIMLVIQLTNPFHRSNQGHDYYTLIGRFSIDLLVRHLTNIIRSTTNREMLFLSLTALANISFITIDPIKKHSTNSVILEMFRTSRKRLKDLELRDQAVTILANTADKSVSDIVNNGGITFLLSCLESCPTRMANYKLSDIDNSKTSTNQQLSSHCKTTNSYDNDYCGLSFDDKPRNRRPINLTGDRYPDALDTCPCDHPDVQGRESYELLTINGHHMVRSSPPQTNRHSRMPPVALELCLSRLNSNELAAIERIHQKTAIAFARMSSDASTTKMVHNYGGMKQMIDLCKFSHKRNHSITVLMACSTALKKMSKIVDREVFKHNNALDIIELDLSKVVDIYGNTGNRQQQRHQMLASEV